jgi:hypothetical protein
MAVPNEIVAPSYGQLHELDAVHGIGLGPHRGRRRHPLGLRACARRAAWISARSEAGRRAGLRLG